MPRYDFGCHECNTHKNNILCVPDGVPVFEDDSCLECPECGKEMERDFSPRRGRQTSTSYGSGVISQAMAISPDQIEEHNKLFPGVEVLPDGCIRFANYKQHDDYLKKTGFHKEPQKLKGLGRVRIDK